MKAGGRFWCMILTFASSAVLEDLVKLVQNLLSAAG